MFIYRNAGGAAGGGAPQQSQQPPAPPAPSGEGGQPPAPPGGASPQFSAEQQAAVDRIVTERLERARQSWQADQDAKAKTDADAAEAKRLEDEKRFEELARKHETRAAELDGRLKTTTTGLERATALVNGLLESKKAGLPESMVKVLEGKDIFDQLEIVDAYLAAQPAGGQGQQRSATKPTPGAQTAGADDHWQQAIKRQQTRATENDPYAAIMKR